MTPIKISILNTGMGTCSLTGRECEGMTVSFDDGTVTGSFLSWKAFRQLLALKTKQNERKPVPTAAPVATGNAVTK